MAIDDGLDRRSFIGTALAVGAAAALPLEARPPRIKVDVTRMDLAALAQGLAEKRFTSVDLVTAYTERIRIVDRNLHAVLELNPDAPRIAAALDRERKEGRVRGPLHGIPVLLKDNLDTADKMKTTAGSLALLRAPAPKEDAFVVQQLRKAGAVILGKTNLSEWANFRSTHSISGWSGRGGLTRNPHALDRNCSGSSSGSGAAMAASLCAAAVGTETDGSIVSPAQICGVVGLKPTVGLLSRAGIIPISHTQDTAGPMTRTVRDAALLLTAMAGVDAADAATTEAKGRLHPDYTAFLQPEGLKGARLGVLKNYTGLHPGLDEALAPAFQKLKALGATLVEVELKSGAFEAAEQEVMLYEFKAGLNAYLARRGGPMKDLEALIAFNRKEAKREMPLFGQELLEQAQAKGPLTEEAYLKALETCRKGARAEGIDAVMDREKLDALIAPTGSPAWLTDPVNGDTYGFSCSTLAAVAGYPHLTVPAGTVHGLPVSLSFMGRAWSEGTLLRFGHAFEQAQKGRREPRFRPHSA
ncbi:MAG TPA: amidase [Holophagaceae bacterium]|nr:amidase [Holophagaceae bacterium]